MTLLDRIADIIVRCAALGMVAMVGVIGWQVFGRFVLDSSPSWTEQAALILMIWYVMFGSAAGVHQGFHIRIALLEERLGARAAPLRRIIALIVMGLGLVLLIYGAQLVWLVRGNALPALGVSRAVAYMPMPIAGLLIALFALPQVWDGKPRGRGSES